MQLNELHGIRASLAMVCVMFIPHTVSGFQQSLVLSYLRLMVFNRLWDPDSKLGVLRWLETVASPADAGIVSEHQHLLRAMNVIHEHSDKLHTRLDTLMRPLIDQDLSVVFYDLTTVAVTGQTNLGDGLPCATDLKTKKWVFVAG